MSEQLPDYVLSIHIGVPVARVWEEITKTGRLQRAMYNTVLESDLQPGSKLRYYSPNRKRVFIVGEVVKAEAPHTFVHTYQMLLNKPEAPTLVTWNLTKEGDGTRVTITHSGYTTDHKAPQKVAAGWREILGLLKAELETGDIPTRTKFTYALMGLFMFMLPSTTKREYADKHGF